MLEYFDGDIGNLEDLIGTSRLSQTLNYIHYNSFSFLFYLKISDSVY
jgi:hypothetical protein